MNASREMPKYECHKKVWALKIAGIVADIHGGVYFQPAEEGYDKVPMSPEYVAKHKPEVGGYYVVYEDGYKSFSPAGAFESGYTPVFTPQMIEAIYAAWHGAGVDIAGGNWTHFVGMLPRA